MTKKKLGVRARVLLIVSLFLLVTNLGLGAVLARQARESMRAQLDGRMLDAVRSAAAMLDGDVLSRLGAEDADSPEYRAVVNTLSVFTENAALDYIYCVRETESGGFEFGVDPDPVSPAEFGSPFKYTKALGDASLGSPSVDSEASEDRWGRFYSAYCPVFDSQGRVACIVAADFSASWYEEQVIEIQRTVLFGSLLFLAAGAATAAFLVNRYMRRLESVRGKLTELDETLFSLTQDPSVALSESSGTDDIGSIEEKLTEITNGLRYHIAHANTQANSMITAMASDYRCVYYVNLDEDDGVCYRGDPDDGDQTVPGIHFPYLERFTWYAEHCVTEKYREGFLAFIEPDFVRASLAEKPIISYRYLAKRNGREYYEMLRMAGVRRAEERDDHIVHAVGLGFTVIDAEMRETMAKNEALAEALTVAEDASKAKTAFLSNMSHEIRTPMNAIIGLDTLALHDKTISPQTRDYLEKIGGSARHLLGLINDILDMSRIESGRLVLRREEFSLRAVLEQINTMVMSQCRDKGLRYECRVINPIDDRYFGDDTKLREVLINVLSNAIKFTEAPGSITLSVERSAVFDGQSTLRFKIKDTGIGMDKEFIPKIFEAFSQEDTSAKNVFGSTGLGMAITKNIVEMMNGTIQVESEKGVGTEFTVTLTLKNAAEKSPEPGESFEPGSLRVLVVDDDEISAEQARIALGEAGIRADTALSGAEALRMADVAQTKQEPYNLVILDRSMPETDGIETARRLRSQYSSAELAIILAAYASDDIKDEAAKAGIDGFLPKPIYAAGVISEFGRIATKNSVSLSREKKQADLNGRRILLAEDVEINADIMIEILSMEGMTTDRAENGRIAVEMFSASEIGGYDAVLMDVRMPEMNGLEAASAIRALDRADAKSTPIIALTANAFDEDVQCSLQAGMNAHLSKPVEPELLYRTLGELIYAAENG